MKGIKISYYSLCRDEKSASFVRSQGLAFHMEDVTCITGLDYYQFLNKIILECKQDFALVCHDDIIFEQNFFQKISEVIQIMDKNFGSEAWGIAGNAGVEMITHDIVRYIHDPHGYDLENVFLDDPIPLISIDGNALLLNLKKLKSRGVSLPKNLSGFHMYENVLLMECYKNGLVCAAHANLFVHHKSAGNQEAFNDFIKNEDILNYLRNSFNDKVFYTINGQIKIENEKSLIGGDKNFEELVLKIFEKIYKKNRKLSGKLYEKLQIRMKLLDEQSDIIKQKEQEIQKKTQEMQQKDQDLYNIRTSLRWKIPNYFYKLYKNKIKKFIPRFIFRLKDVLIIIFYKFLYLFKKINIKKIKNSIIQSDPQITIGIASYNHSKYLRQCIESALSQDYKKYDILIVDDNSSDPKNREILKEYESNDKITIIYNDKNEGISASLNKQVLNAKGDWVAFMDCDDYLPTNALSAMASYIRSNSRFRLIYSNRIEVDENDKFLRKVWFGSRALNKNPFNELLKGMVSSHLKIIHKDAFRKVGLFDPRFGGTHDYDMFLRVAFYMPEAFGFIDKYLYYHRIHGNQNTLVENDKHKKNVEIILKEARFRKMVYSGEFDKKVSIVILSFNRFGQLKSTIDNILKKAKNINYEILIWDNGSSYEKVLKYLHSIDGKNRIRVIFSKENIKAAGGRCEATKLVNGDYVLYFDNDIEVAKNFLEELVIRIEESDEIASCCARIIFPDHTVQYTGGITEKLNDGFIKFYLDNMGCIDDDLNTMIKRDYDWLGTGATMTKRKYLHLANFDAGFINAYEDNDYYMQLVKNGLRIVHAPTASVIHHHVKYELKKDAGTEKYVSVRHDKDSFMLSWSHFYKKWNLIIKDDFILGIAGLKDKTEQEIKDYLDNLLANKHIK